MSILQRMTREPRIPSVLTTNFKWLKAQVLAIGRQSFPSGAFGNFSEPFAVKLRLFKDFGYLYPLMGLFINPNPPPSTKKNNGDLGRKFKIQLDTWVDPNPKEGPVTWSHGRLERRVRIHLHLIRLRGNQPTNPQPWGNISGVFCRFTWFLGVDWPIKMEHFNDQVKEWGPFLLLVI